MAINPKYLYVCPADVAKAYGRHFINSHWIDLDGKNVLLSGEFADESRKDLFEKNVTVQAFAHDGDTVTEAHAHVLAHLGVKAGHTAKQVRVLAKKIHPLL
jgi:hypothetical protein